MVGLVSPILLLRILWVQTVGIVSQMQRMGMQELKVRCNQRIWQSLRFKNRPDNQDHQHVIPTRHF